MQLATDAWRPPSTPRKTISRYICVQIRSTLDLKCVKYRPDASSGGMGVSHRQTQDCCLLISLISALFWCKRSTKGQ